ncbi:protein-glutamine gamma-glutamyltransferase E-like [Pelodytes ibericus]
MSFGMKNNPATCQLCFHVQTRSGTPSQQPGEENPVAFQSHKRLDWTSGLLQSSVIGRILFNLFINNLEEGLLVLSADFQINANRAAHHTSSYINQNLILRRNQSFNVNLNFNQTPTDKDHMQFNVRLLTENTSSSLLQITFTDSFSPQTNTWAAQRGTAGSNSMMITFFTPPNAVIGRYELEVQMSGGSTRIGNFILLFNPWARDDVVYMENEAQRQEYVMTEFGMIYVGETDNPQSIPWDYGQFQDNILDICLVILDSTMNYRRNQADDVRKRNDPTYLCRVLSAIINSMDDNGVVMGSWSGDYSEGTDPVSWTGSSRILKSWYSERKPAKFGQCWVFAGIVCTVSRALGIPCRVITNFSSAHDSNGNLSIETYYKVTGEPVEKGGDSIWNFHCWNESWFQRYDLGKNYSGWQIWDSTPQEVSDGIYQLGPTSQRAIKEGDVDKLYDTRFVFTEVNADITVFTIQENESLKKPKTYTSSVGLLLCTKAVGVNSMNNITDEYKYREGTSEEREVYNKARSLTGGTSGFVAFSAAGNTTVAPTGDSEVSGQITVTGTPTIGDDINIILSLKNLTSENKNVTANLNVSAIVYNKVVRRPILYNSTAVQLNPNEEKPVALQIAYSQYETLLTSDNMIQISSVCHVEGWGELIVDKSIKLQTPPLLIQALGPAVLGSPLKVEVTFTNPLKKPVTNCVLTAEGSGVTQEVIQKSIGVLESTQKISISLDTVPFMPGTKQLLINLISDEFHDIKGFITIDVTED